MNKKLSFIFFLVTVAMFAVALSLSNSHPHLSSSLTMTALLLNAIRLGVDILLDKRKQNLPTNI